MITTIREIQNEANQILLKVKKHKAKQITQISIIKNCKGIVDNYFRNFRDKCPESNYYSSLEIIDDYFQNLLLLTHKNSSTTKYRKLLETIKTQLINLEAQTLSTTLTKAKISKYDKLDEQIISTLIKFIPSASASYNQALIDLEGNDRFSWRGPATDLRESLRECLDYLAPDKDVEAQSGFRFEKDLKSPTMKQKVKYIMKNRGKGDVEIKTTENSLNLVEELFGTFVRSVYTRASVSTHTATTKKEVVRLLGMIKLIFSEILELN